MLDVIQLWFLGGKCIFHPCIPSTIQVLVGSGSWSLLDETKCKEAPAPKTRLLSFLADFSELPVVFHICLQIVANTSPAIVKLI